MITIGTIVNTSGTNVGSLISPTVESGTDKGYVLAVYMSGGELVSTVTGGSLTWTQQVVQPGGRSQTAVELWTAFGSPSAFTVTVNFVGNSSSAIIIVMPLIGLDVSVPYEDGVGANTNGEGGAGAGGTDDDNVELTTGSTRFDSMHIAALNPRDTTIAVADPNFTNQETIGPVGAGGNTINGILETFIKTATGDDLYEPTLTADVDWSAAGIVARRAFITTPTDVNKGAEYRVNFEDEEVIKTGEYRTLLADIDIVRLATYRIQEEFDINKAGNYAILIGPNTDINLSVIYRMLLQADIPLGGEYRIKFGDIDINRDGKYRIANVTDISIPGTYHVIDTPEVTKLAGYSVGPVKDFNLIGTYKILMADQDITKDAPYRILLADNDLNLAATYKMLPTFDIALTGQYHIINLTDILKAGQYHLLPTFENVLGGEYRMKLEDDIDVGADFNTKQETDIQLVATYRTVNQPVVELNIILSLLEDEPGPEVVISLPLEEV